MLQYKTVAEFRSKTKPGKCYVVKKRLDTGNFTCNCPAWIFNKYEDRSCYHTMRVTAISGMNSKKSIDTIDASESISDSGRRMLILDE